MGPVFCNCCFVVVASSDVALISARLGSTVGIELAGSDFVLSVFTGVVGSIGDSVDCTIVAAEFELLAVVE